MSTSIQAPKYRLSRRGRQLRTALLIALLATASSTVLQFQPAKATSSSSHAEFKYVSVRAGETLWQIAERYAPQSDPREFIQAVVSLNQLPSASVDAGQRIALPSN